MADARMTFRGAAGSTVRRARGLRLGVSGGERAADENPGRRGAGGDAASGGGEGGPGLGLVITVPAAVDGHAPPAQVVQGRVAVVAADRGGEAGGGGAGAGGDDGGAAGGG